MHRSAMNVRSVLTLVAFAVCVGYAQGQGTGDASPHLAGTVPGGWAFPPERVVVARGGSGMVSTTDRVASEVGAEVLRRGGNAVDAAIATHFALAVVNPEAGNIGGGGFMVLRTANGQTAALDFRETAPLAATRDMYLDARGELTDKSRIGHLAAGVPGSVAGMWAAHQRFGSMEWAELLQPAVHLALGIVVHDRLAESLQRFEGDLLRYRSTSSVFLVNGRAPRVGDRLAQRDLAETLERIRRSGDSGFYRGRTADLIESEMRRGGGIMTREDLRRYEAVWRTPIEFQYRRHTIVSMPPPSSGGATIAEILNILEGFDLRSLGYLSRDHVHLWAEAVKRAFVDRNTYLGDPDFTAQPVERMISDAYAAERRKEIRVDAATASSGVHPGMGGMPHHSAMLREGDHTTHYSVVDRSGNAVAVTTTINSLYGSLATVSGAGFLLNNEMDDFAARPGSANQFGLVQGAINAIEPKRRMLSAMSPTILIDPTGRVKLVTGSPGGPTIITTVAQMISNVVDFEMDIAAATAAPRLHHQHLPDVLHYERSGLRPDVVSGLQGLGHVLQARPGYQGDTQTIFVSTDGASAGAADPRRGGAAVGVRQVVQTVQ